MKHMNVYADKMDQVEISSGLKESVLARVRQEKSIVEKESCGKKEQASTKSLRPRQRKLIFASVGAAAIFALVAVIATGGMLGKQENLQTDAGVLWQKESFALVAYATESGVQYAPDGEVVLFGTQGIGMSDDSGMYTGCLFSIEGEDIEQVSLSLSRGQIYGYAEQEYVRTTPYSGEDDAYKEAYALIDYKLGGPHDPDGEAGRGAGEEDAFVASGCRLLGSDCSILVASSESGRDLGELKFGFWLSPEDMVPVEASDFWTRSLDSLDGETLNVTVLYGDGSSDRQTYLLETGNMKIEKTVSGIRVLPERASGDELFIYAVYGTLIS